MTYNKIRKKNDVSSSTLHQLTPPPPRPHTQPHKLRQHEADKHHPTSNFHQISHNNQGSKKERGARNNNNNKSEILTWKASEDFATRKRGMHKQTDHSFRNGFAHESRGIFLGWF